MSEPSIMQYWPMPNYTPRRTQEEVLQWIESLPPEVKYILVEAPVGAGKSPLALNLSGYLARSLGDSYILTPQKILQRQYENSFESKRIFSVYGKSNYECTKKKTNCDIGGDIKPPCENCPAKSALGKAAQSPNAVLNYTLALLLFKFLGPSTSGKMRKRRLMVFDECHTLENHLTEFNAVSIGDLRCKKLKVHFHSPKTITDAMEWIQSTYMPVLDNKLKQLLAVVNEIQADVEYNPRGLTRDEQNAISELKEFGNHAVALDNLIELGLEQIQERFVLVQEKKSFKFKELYGRNVFHSLVKPMADRFLFMSSTILNKDAFCRDLGLNADEAAFISMHSEFPAENRPVIYDPIMKMNYGWEDATNLHGRQNMIMRIKDLCDFHENESGIIHTGSFKISEWLVEELSGLVKHDVMHHNPSAKVKRDDVINEFQRVSPTTPTLLISPSITEGLDLKDDLARFAIFVKVPFPFLGDAWVKRRMELSGEWYSRQAMIAIIQGGGRIVRTPTDYGYTYILDASFNYLYYQMNKWVPDWWKEGYQQM